LTCPDPTPGSVTDPTGAINGTALADLTDAYAQKQGVSFQWQYWVGLSTKPGVCAHYRANQTVEQERWLLITLIGSRDPMDYGTCPYPVVPVTLTVGQATHDGGNLYTVNVNYASHNGRCAQSSEDATDGTVTFTTVSDTLLEGSYALDFGADHVEGTFSAPYCVLCTTRPTKKTCVAS
jgi:hypothetical protein